MIDVLIAVSQRHVVITLAILGAAIATAGALMAKPQTGDPVLDEKNAGTAQARFARALTFVGYAITGLSVALFIAAGFVSDLRP